MGILAFSVLSVVDAYTTIIGLSRGLQETEAFALLLMSNFGIGGFLLFKISLALVVATVALIYDDRLRNHSEFSHAFYVSVSVSLLCVSLVPVLNNMVRLGWL